MATPDGRTPGHLPAFCLLYADACLLVLNKPSGLLCVPGRGADKQDCLSARVQADYPQAQVVHRLDMATSGLVLMALGLPAQRRLQAAFAQRQVHKRYTAVVEGLVPTAADNDALGWHTLEMPIRADWPRRPLRVVDPLAGQASTTRWRLLVHDAAAGTSRLLLEPVTGRTHQLRVHMQALGHPILGDTLYAPAAVAARSSRLLLHATTLAFTHPGNGRVMAFEWPADF